jgi:cold shock CspA family protein
MTEEEMARSLAGLDLQVAIAGHLKNADFKVQTEEEWDHNNKIDFVVTKFPRYPKSVSLGVQITARCGNAQKLNEFVAKNDPANGIMTIANKALYMEIEDDVDINKGGAELVAQILWAFQFDEQFAKSKIWAARLLASTDSIAYRFFDPRRIESLAPVAAPHGNQAWDPVADLSKSVSQLTRRFAGSKLALEGTLHTFKPQEGYGFIDGQDGGTYFLHINEVKDPVLMADLNGLMKLQGKARVEYRVLFEDGGRTRPNAPYQTATNCRMLMRC